MYCVNAYYDLIDDFLTIYIYLDGPFSMIYIRNDVKMCSNIIHFPDIYFVA